MMIGSQAAVPWLYGDAATLAQANARFLDIFVHTMLAVVVLSALLMWRLFMRLEAIEGRGLELHLPAWLFKPRVHLAAARSARSVWQQMLGKELHLQQITFVVSGLYVVAWLAVVLVGESLFPTRRAGYMTAATLLHAGAIPLLAGSLASAEERQLGTLGWQVLLPIAAWRQWAVKAAVVLVLSLGLAIGVPAILYALFASGPGPVRLGWPPAAAIAAVATVSLYASSLSTNGVRALARVAPAIGGVMLVAHITMNVVMPGWMPLAWDLPNAAWAVLYAASAAVFAWLLWLGMKNHGSAERGAKRVLKQVAALGAVAVVAMLAFAAAARAEVLAPQRNFDERIRTRVAFEVEERGWVADRSAIVAVVLPAAPPQHALNACFRLAFAMRVARKWDGRCAAQREHRGTGRNALTGTVLALLHTPPKENLDEEDHRRHRLRAVSVRHERAGTSSARARRLGVRPAGL